MTEKEQLLEDKEREVLEKTVGSLDVSRIQRVFSKLNKSGEYTLVYDEKELGKIKYSFDNDECIIIFDPNNKHPII